MTIVKISKIALFQIQFHIQQIPFSIPSTWAPIKIPIWSRHPFPAHFPPKMERPLLSKQKRAAELQIKRNDLGPPQPMWTITIFRSERRSSADPLSPHFSSTIQIYPGHVTCARIPGSMHSGESSNEAIGAISHTRISNLDYLYFW